ncbi:MAG: hypothetical protein ACYTEQ_21145 [Planctomycetota bacterium]|jgi:hypothetical protein
MKSLRRTISVLQLSCLLIVVASCGQNSEQNVEKNTPPQNSPPKSQTKKAYTVIKSERADYGIYKRQIISIAVDDQSTEEEIRASLMAAFDKERDSDLDAVRILAFRKSQPRKTGSMFAVGTLIHAPNARWEDVEQRTNFRIEIKINTENKIGERQEEMMSTKGRIVSDGSKRVGLHSSSSDLSEDTLITKVRVGTKVEILEKKEEQLTQTAKWCVYRIKAKRKSGWVFCSDVELEGK